MCVLQKCSKMKTIYPKDYNRSEEYSVNPYLRL